MQVTAKLRVPKEMSYEFVRNTPLNDDDDGARAKINDFVQP